MDTIETIIRTAKKADDTAGGPTPPESGTDHDTGSVESQEFPKPLYFDYLLSFLV